MIYFVIKDIICLLFKLLWWCIKLFIKLPILALLLLGYCSYKSYEGVPGVQDLAECTKCHKRVPADLYDIHQAKHDAEKEKSELLKTWDNISNPVFLEGYCDKAEHYPGRFFDAKSLSKCTGKHRICKKRQLSHNNQKVWKFCTHAECKHKHKTYYNKLPF